NSFLDSGIKLMFQMSPWVTASSSSNGLVGVVADYTQDMRPGTYGSDITNAADKIYEVDIDMLNNPAAYDDFQNWPVDQGAAWVDVDGDGQFNPLPNGPDHPKFYGDYVMFFVSADDDPAYKLNDMSSSPTGLEFQTTVFAFNRPNHSMYEDIVFYRTLLINKGTDTLSQTYFGMWADPDLGNPGNDFVGVQVGDDFMYAWNDGQDYEINDNYGESYNAAVGVQLLQGPMVDCSSDGSVDIILIGSDQDGDALDYFISNNPSNGSISLSENVATYTPNQGFSGNDSFEYYVSDGEENSNTATVSIIVYDQNQTNLPRIITPNGAETLSGGQSYQITWTNGFSNTGIELFKGNSEVLDISEGVGNVSSFTWTVPSDSSLYGDNFRVRIYNVSNSTEQDFSDNFFRINQGSLKEKNSELVNDLDNLYFEKLDEVIAHSQNVKHQHVRSPDGFIRCSTDELEEHLQIVNPEYIQKRDEFLQKIKKQSLGRSAQKSNEIIIPVIFHVLYNDQSDNLSKDYIAANFDQINLDFRNTNPDGSKVPSSANPSDAPSDPSIDYNHASERGTHNIKFVGANGEIQGNDLVEDISIIRYNINKTTVADLSDAYQLVNSTNADNNVQGGFKNGYMNIYIAPLGSGLLGQATLGGTTHCVISTGSVGSVDFPGTSAPYDKGRTLTHELGHNFTYNHIFNSTNCNDQLWADIPAQTSANYNAEVYEFNNQWYGKDANNNCIGTSNKGDQFTNYMDYNADSDLIMFSNLQAVDGYNWASNISWAQVNVTPSNNAPVATSFTTDAYINEVCGLGGQMFGQIFPNKKNLPLSSASFYINTDDIYTDPENITEARYYMLGFRKDGSAYPTDIAGESYNQKFVFYGDPNQAHSSSNPVDGNYAAASDRRFLMNVGPFTMVPGDSQEVIFAMVPYLAETDALGAVNGLFNKAETLRENYISLFNNFDRVADVAITTSSSSGAIPLEVNFGLNGDISEMQFAWDFDNDGIMDSNAHSPTYVFEDPGQHTVTLFYTYKDYENGNAFLKTESVDVVIYATSANHPIVSDLSLTTNEDTAVSQQLSATNPLSNTSVSFFINENPKNGSVSISGSQLIYTPNTNFFGNDTLRYIANNGDYDSNVATIDIAVNPVDDTPLSIDVNVSVNEDEDVQINLTAEEYDGDDYEFSIIDNPKNGSLSNIDGSNITYTPNANWYGVDYFTYQADDVKSQNIATVAITVEPTNDPPTSNNMNISSYEDLELSITLSASDIDGDQLSYFVIGSPSYGSLDTSQLSSGGNIVVYSPNQDWYGTDSFSFYVNDGATTSSSSTVTLTLDSVNDQSNKFNAFGKYEINDGVDVKEIVTTNLLLVTPEIESDSLIFNWEESIDVDGDVIQYRMIGYDGLEFLTMDTWTEDLTLSWSIKDLVSNTDTVNVASGSWVVEATDGEFFVLSNDGNPIDFSINGSALIPDDYMLLQNYPNPFNELTTIRFNNPFPQQISIKVYDLRGALIKELINEEVNAGYNNIVWDGKNSDGESVSSGVYFYQIHAKKDSDGNKFVQTKKMLKLK
ncbi:tandem-95 repeat protein, partial [archaeon]|nr:tandem-95 repeat protein [archaeon]